MEQFEPIELKNLKLIVSQKDYEILRYIDQNKSIILEKLHKDLNIPKTTLNYHIRRLEKYHLLEIEARLGRVRPIKLTEKGKSYVPKKSLEVENQILKLNRDLVENSVKNHLEIIILSMLSEKPMSGYDIIKETFEKYNILLTQGIVYPFLYSLKEEGILQVEFLKGDMRTKIYSATQKGKQIIKKRIDDFIEAEEYILNSIKKMESYVYI
jgi:DNA-binding PadR family transcriptional regulator